MLQIENYFRARATLPSQISLQNDVEDGIVITATNTIPAKTRLGPFEARRTTNELVADDGFVLKVCSHTPELFEMLIQCFNKINPFSVGFNFKPQIRMSMDIRI